MSFNAIFECWSHQTFFTEIKDESKTKSKMDSIVSEILNEIIERSYKAVGDDDKGTNESAASHCYDAHEVSEIIAEIIERSCTPSDDIGTNENAECHSAENGVGEIIAQIVESAFDAHTVKSLLDPSDAQDSDDSIIVDCVEICKNRSRASSPAVVSDEPSGMVQVEKVPEEKLNEKTVEVSTKIVPTEHPSGNDKGTNESAASHCYDAHEVSEIIAEIIERSCTPSDDIGTNESAECHSAENGVGEIIAQIVESAYDAHTVKSLLDPSDAQDSDDSIIVDCVEICKNRSRASSPAVVSDEPSGMVQVEKVPEEKLNEKTVEVSTKIVPTKHPSGVTTQVNEKHDGDLNVQQAIVDKTLTESTNSVGESLKERDQCYSIDELHRRGYFTKFSGDLKCVTNLSLPLDAVGTSKVQCRGLPRDMTENKLIPLLERYGRILELRFANDVINVTFMTDQEGNNAIKGLNGQIVQGRRVKVEKTLEMNQLHVRGIPNEATKAELLHYFSKLTKGLVQLFLLYSHVVDTHNRGYCYLIYRDYGCALDAKRIIMNSLYGGRKLFADWAERQCPPRSSKELSPSRMFLTQPPRKLFMNNLRAGLTTSDLRKVFSSFGDVMEVDKNGSWASVKFRHPSETKRALLYVDRKLLGGDKVGLSLNELPE